ncbi:GmrSD restriction endonuclease domain-containing protein [Williamsia maris]|uniref:Excalibur calcium-binding domain-containing protein n=1 Tax=Williamsia maris TaxID=72806 RepID=A0ABT1HCP5_9NOCA|nr:DUF1524 domain-containing protein [Williamsia maris]MCP2175944.1 Excalibur calcium-binding domain-containing protein [Williamsia maris]
MTGSSNSSVPAEWNRPPGYKKSPRRRRRWPWIALGAVVAITVVGLIAPDDTKQSNDQAAAVIGSAPATTAAPATSSDPISSSETPAPAPSTPAQVGSGSAAQSSLTLLNTLAVKGRAPRTGYSRAQFGQAWTDDVNVDGGHNGCDTRNDILRRDLTSIVARSGSRGCVVTSGVLADPYTGTRIDFVRGEKTSQAVQIDHVVALDDAWQKGAQQLSADTRRDLANDPRNLQATDGPTNSRKGSGDAATWLPPNRSFRCTYVARQVTVKAAYRLWVTQAEKDAIARVLGSCGAVIAAPVAPSQPTRTQTQTPVPRPAPRYTPPPPAPVAPAIPDGGDVSYANCAAVRAAGAAPIRVGDPGYSTKLDRDRDGVGCE